VVGDAVADVLSDVIGTINSPFTITTTVGFGASVLGKENPIQKGGKIREIQMVYFNFI